MVWVLAAVLLVLNFLDFFFTWVAISVARGAEANPFILMLGGPLSPISILMKLVVVPGVVVGAVWWLTTHRSKDTTFGVAAIIPAVAVYAGTVANNVLVAAKKVKKRATVK